MKTLSMPQEVEAYYLIPAIRRELVACMVKAGVAQSEIAGRLGITEAAVSQYMKGKRASGGVKFDGKVEGQIKRSAKIILKNSDAIREIRCICEVCRKEMVLCRIHKSRGGVPEGCRICMED